MEDASPVVSDFRKLEKTDEEGRRLREGSSSAQNSLRMYTVLQVIDFRSAPAAALD